MTKINYYKQAPTFLYNLGGESKLFKTQEEVDDAWGNGWFGPLWLARMSPLLSTLDLGNKADMIETIRDDPRYRGIRVHAKMTTVEIEEAVAKFEEVNKVSEDVYEDGE